MTDSIIKYLYAMFNCLQVSSFVNEIVESHYIQLYFLVETLWIYEYNDFCDEDNYMATLDLRINSRISRNLGNSNSSLFNLYAQHVIV